MEVFLRMDLIDEQIIKELSMNSRLSMSELGRRVHLSSPNSKRTCTTARGAKNYHEIYN